MMTQREIRYDQRKEEQKTLNELERLYMAFASQLVLQPLVGMHIRAGEDRPMNMQTKKFISKSVEQLNERVYNITLKGITSGWGLGESLSEMQVPEKYRQFFQTLPTSTAQEAFINRKTKGLKLSERVWRLNKQTQVFIETSIQQGIQEGKSAQSISKDLRMYLKNPDRYFRRVRDNKGDLKLSQSAKNFNPGRGVYRSPYKNAVRLASNEINKAFRTAERQRYLTNPAIIGYRIRLSNNHTLNGKPFTDMCDYLTGTYPKDFVWSGWHVKCRCQMIPILCNENEFNKLLNANNSGKTYTPEQIKERPQGLFNYLNENKDRYKPGTADWIDENKLMEKIN